MSKSLITTENGAGNEIYITKDFSNFSGKKFNDAAQAIFARTGALLMGVCKVPPPASEEPDARRKSSARKLRYYGDSYILELFVRDVLLNPGKDYTIEQVEEN